MKNRRSVYVHKPFREKTTFTLTGFHHQNVNINNRLWTYHIAYSYAYVSQVGKEYNMVNKKIHIISSYSVNSNFELLQFRLLLEDKILRGAAELGHSDICGPNFVQAWYLNCCSGLNKVIGVQILGISRQL